jgi:hypothetical protein
MSDRLFASDADRIAYSQAVDFLEQGHIELVPPDAVDRYIGQGLWMHDGAQVVLTEEGRRQHRIASGERFSDG